MNRPRTRAYIKREVEDTKEYFKDTLYPPVKIEPHSIEMTDKTKRRHCIICNITFIRRNNYLDHELHSHNTKEIPIIDLKSYYCNICNKYFRSITSYRRHMAVKNNIQIPFTKPHPKPDLSKTPDIEDPNNYCISCDHTFKSRETYHRHWLTIHKISSVTKCFKDSLKLKNIKPTIDMLNQYCDVCEKKIKFIGGYIRHLLRIHGMVLPDTYLKSSNVDLNKVSCKICGIRYKSKQTLIVHSRKAHQTVLPSRSNLVPIIDDKNKYCIICDKHFFGRTSYISHLVSIHPNKNPELYRGVDCKIPHEKDLKIGKYCSICQKIFLSKRLCRMHADKTHGIKPLECLPLVDDTNNHCTSCDKTYKTKFSLGRHLISAHNYRVPVNSRAKIINGEKKPVLDFSKNYCDACNKIYKNVGSYRSHLNRYHGVDFLLRDIQSSKVSLSTMSVMNEKYNYCTLCNKGYKSEASYRSHLYRVHNAKLPSPSDKNKHCVSCNLTYSRKLDYLNHMVDTHNTKELGIKQEDTKEKLSI